jgi:hypothetical protein
MNEITRRPRISVRYDDENTAVVLSCPKEWEEDLVIPMNSALNPVARRLALMGLADHLMRAARGADRRADIQQAMANLIEKGMDTFPVPGATAKNLLPRKPSLRRRTQALAALLNTTVDFVTAKLKEKTEEERDVILNDERVIAKAHEMAQSEASTLL